MNILAIDIGGTTIKSDVYCCGESLKQFIEVPTKVDLHAQTNDILNQIESLIKQTINNLDQIDQTLDGVAIATAGVVDTDNGTVVYAGYTIPNYTNTNFKEMIRTKFNLPSIVLNDVNSATYAEYKLNHSNSDGTLICLTIGTGIGSGIIINHQLLIGHHFSAGEIGYMPMKESNYQNIASTTALIKRYQEETGIKEADGKEIFKAYQKEEKAAKLIINEWIDQLVEGLLPVIYILNPTTIALGGGVMAQYKLLMPSIKERLKERLESSFFMPYEIKPMKVGNEAGRLGAYYYFIDYVNPQKNIKK